VENLPQRVRLILTVPPSSTTHSLLGAPKVMRRSCRHGPTFELGNLDRLLVAGTEWVSQSRNLTDVRTDSKSLLAVAVRKGPFVADHPMRFRAIADSLAASHLEWSECCLIHVDNPLSPAEHIYVNPNVRVAYGVDVYDVVHSICSQSASGNQLT
jgi:hypothetical protein